MQRSVSLLEAGWLRSNNIESPYRELGALSRVHGQTSRSRNGAAELAAKIVDNGPKTSLLKKFGLEGPSNAHAVAAAVDGEKVTFFDPKFGLSGEFSIVNLEANH
ncbi:YopT-type cysteine protease domain-containing protein [Vibrio sp. M260121]|uniref:YopT-type cysteine protease domain-containing protein n=1 Tax=Vibrio sp. M260121 TaxID=3020897 RepID=UPI002F42C3D7